MKRIDFMDYLVANGCEVVRTDKKGYSVLRHTVSGKISGVPATDPPRMTTVCVVCRNLGVEIPDIARPAEGLVDKIRGVDQNDEKE